MSPGSAASSAGSSDSTRPNSSPNTNDLLLSLTNRIYAKRGDTVQEIFTWELMQKRYFDPTFGVALVPGQRNVFDATADAGRLRVPGTSRAAHRRSYRPMRVSLNQ